ncbi:MAG: YihY/virulence factor BrkB family protein [Acidobacteriota bacterium]
MHGFARLIKDAAVAWVDDAGSSMGAALAYYTLFSIAPLILIVVSVAGLVFGEEASRGALVTQLSGFIGPDSAKGVEGLLQHSSRPATGLIASTVGVVTLLIGATSVVTELQADLDRVWRAEPTGKTSNIVLFLQSRLLSFGLILALGFLLLVSLVMGAALTAVGAWWASVLHGWGFVLQIANVLLSFALSTVLFALIYKILPRARIAWSDVWIGAAVTSALFSVGKWLISLYVGYAGIASPFGAAGSVVLVMVWVYYSAQIFVLGAEFTWLYAHAYGTRVGVDIPQAQVR